MRVFKNLKLFEKNRKKKFEKKHKNRNKIDRKRKKNKLKFHFIRVRTIEVIDDKPLVFGHLNLFVKKRLANTYFQLEFSIRLASTIQQLENKTTF